jgi:hypothetical protein
MAIPTPQEQVEFLQKTQRLLTDGLFVASYKFALLRALADLAVLKGDDSGDELRLDTSEIAAVFIELYWRQTRPFPAPSAPAGLLLRQNTGQQAAIIRRIAAAQDESGGSLARLRRDPPRWDQLVREVAGVIAVMPLWKLQRVGDDEVDFLYPNVGRGRTIALRPGVAYCLRTFYGLLRNLVEGAWITYVRRVNHDLLGQTVDLGSFLFGMERSTLEVYRPILRDIQRDSCFYCHSHLRTGGEVDHFIPWSRYPHDLGHNFVLAHRMCNSQKRDHLASEEHLAAWKERNTMHADTLAAYFERTRALSDIGSTVSIARWAYSQTAQVNGLVWIRGDLLQHLGNDWQRLLSAA